MDTLQTQNTKPVEKPKDDGIEKLKQDIKDLSLAENLALNPDGLLRELSQLIKTENKDEKHQKRLNEVFQRLTYNFMLENGVLLATIPRGREQGQGLLAIRRRLIAEHNCTTAAELILVDEIVAAYGRLMKYEAYACKVPEKENGGWSITQLSVNFLKEIRNLIEQAHRQIDVSLSMLKNLKQPQLKVNVKTENAYFAQNQQVINEKPADEPSVETIKPK